ncbi:MAG TPA: hypothetical protein PK685_03695 [archaeon]|nr:hypothetical protein [archaeon]
MPVKRTNKYPNNRYDNKNVKRTKKITPHITKNKADKPNRNGFVKETIPAQTEYYLRAPKLDSQKNNSTFIQSIFSKDGYYNYLWVPFVLLFVTLILDFSLQFAVYSNLNPYYVNLAKDSLFFLMFSIVLLCINIGAFVYMGLESAKHNLQFKKVIKTIFKIVLIVFVIETVFTLFSFFTFLTPYIAQMFTSQALKSQYLYYLLSWNLIKSILYLLMVSISYLLFFKLKFI